LRSELDWSDKISLQQGIEDVIGWARRFKDDLASLPIRYEHKP
jgi:dTDP-glucose 4,6-dehydratase